MGPKTRDSSAESRSLSINHPPPSIAQTHQALSCQSSGVHLIGVRLQKTEQIPATCPVAVAFGRIARRLRQGQKMSLVELAHRSQVDLVRLMQMDRGERSPTIIELVHLATALGVRASALLRCLDG